MEYIKLDFRNFYTNKIIRAVFIFLLAIMILAPITAFVINNIMDIMGGQHWFAENIGNHPFQFWLLMDSVAWGHSVYHTVLWLMPVLVTGLTLYSEKMSSMQMWMLIRGNKTKYYLSKILTQFVTAFIIMFSLLGVNVAVTYMIYPADAPMTQQCLYLIPAENAFSRFFYNISPLCEVIVYVVINALAVALLSLIVLAIHEMVEFKNRYMAILIPYIGIYVCKYFAGVTLPAKYKLDIILQPRAACAVSNELHAEYVWLVFGFLVVIDVILLVAAYKRNRDVY